MAILKTKSGSSYDTKTGKKTSSSGAVSYTKVQSSQEKEAELKKIDESSPLKTTASRTSVSPTPQTKDEANSQLEQIFNDNYEEPTGRASADALSKISEYLTTKPETPSLEDTYADLNEEYGIDNAQDEYNASRSELRALEDEIASEKYQAKGTIASSRYINRRLVNIDQQTADALNTARTRVQDTADFLNSRNQIVSQMMELKQRDYQNSKSEFDSKFSQALQMYNALEGEEDKQRNTYKAQLDTMLSLAKEKPEAFQNPSPELKLQLNTLETKLGYPQGMFESFVTAKPKAEILFHSKNDDGSTTIVYKDQATGKAGQVEVIKGSGGISPAGKLSSTVMNAAVSSGVPGDVAQGIYDDLYQGYSLEAIRQNLAGELGQDIGYKYLDIFLPIYQKQYSKSAREV